MKVAVNSAMAIAAAALLAGCAADLPPARVTRFHLSQPIAPATIAIVPSNPMLENDLEFRAYAGAVAQRFEVMGFRATSPTANPELVATIAVQRSWRPTGPARSPFTIGIGAGTSTGHVGLGGSVAVPVGAPKTPMASATELTIKLRRRTSDAPLWEGRASMEARDGTPYASGEAAVTRLATALLQGFPGESGRTIIVK